MIAVGIRELKERLSWYVNRASKGEEIVVTAHGKEVALVVPISREREAVKNLIDSGRATWTGGKPGSRRPVKIRGKSLSSTVLEGRR